MSDHCLKGVSLAALVLTSACGTLVDPRALETSASGKESAPVVTPTTSDTTPNTAPGTTPDTAPGTTTPTSAGGPRACASFNFAAQVRYDVGTFPEGVAVADVDGDNRSDIVVVNNFDDTVSVLINKGGGAL